MKLVNFYEIMNSKGDIETGTASASEAIKWFRKGFNNSIFVSVWNEEDIEEPRLVIDKIEISSVIRAAIALEHDRTFGVSLR